MKFLHCAATVKVPIKSGHKSGLRVIWFSAILEQGLAKTSLKKAHLPAFSWVLVLGVLVVSRTFLFFWRCAMDRRWFLGLCGGAALALVGCDSSSPSMTLLELLQQQEGKEFLAERRMLNGRETLYVIGIRDQGTQEYRLEDRVKGYSWIFYVGDEHQRVLVDKSPSEYLVAPGTRVYAAYEPWQSWA